VLPQYLYLRECLSCGLGSVEERDVERVTILTLIAVDDVNEDARSHSCSDKTGVSLLQGVFRSGSVTFNPLCHIMDLMVGITFLNVSNLEKISLNIVSLFQHIHKGKECTASIIERGV
jgi:hypothetical protein